MSRTTNIQFTITIIALVAFSQTMKYAKGDSSWSMLKPLRSSAEITEGVHQIVTYTFVDIFDFAVEEKASLKSQLEFLINLDLNALYADKDFQIISKQILLSEVEKVIKKNFKALAIGAECDAQSEIYNLVKEYIQYQLYTNGWNAELNLEDLYSDIMVTVNSQMELLVQKLRQRIELMITVQADTVEEFNLSGKPFTGLKNSITKLLLVGGSSLINELINSITINDEEYDQSKLNDTPYDAIKPKLAQVDKLFFKLKHIIDQDPTDIFLNLLKQTVKDLYRARKNLPRQAQRDFVSQVIYSLLGLIPSTNKLSLLKSALRSIEDPAVSKLVKSPALKQFKRLVKAIPLEDVDLTDENLPDLIIGFDQSNIDGEYDPFNIELQPYVDRLLKINSNFLNVPEAIGLFRLSSPRNVPVFQTLYKLLSKVRADNIDKPLSEDDIISKLIEQINSGDWANKGNDLATILILLNIESDPNIELSPTLVQHLDLTDSSVLDLLNDDKFKSAVKGLLEAGKKAGSKNHVNGLIDNLGNNLLITKIGKLRSYETEYLANPLNTNEFLQSHTIDLDALYSGIEGSAYRGEELIVLLVNPKGSVCYEQSLKDYFSSYFL